MLAVSRKEKKYRSIFVSLSSTYTFQPIAIKNHGELSSATWVLFLNLVIKSILSVETSRKVLVHNVAQVLPFNLLKADLWSANPLSNAEVWSKGFSGNVCDHPLNLTGCHSNVPWATSKRTLVIIPTNTSTTPVK